MNDAVARHHARLGAWSVGDNAQDDDRIGCGVEHHADAVKLTLQRLVYRLHIARRDILRVWVELLHHKWDDKLGERIHRDGVNILVLHQHTGLHQLVWRGQTSTADEGAQLRLRLVATHKLTQQYSQYNSHRQNEWEYDSVF